MILITHDIGDSFLAVGRAYTEFKNKKDYIMVPVMCAVIFSWVYGRAIIMTPLSLKEIYRFYISRESLSDYEMQRFGYCLTYLVFMILVLIPMSFYWIFHLISFGLSVIKNKKYINHYENKGKNMNFDPKT